MPFARRRPVAGIATLGVAALIAGCGGSSASLSADEFRTQADAICADYNAKSDALTDPSSPAEYLPSLKAIVPLQDAQLAKLKELKPPSELSGTYGEAIALLEKQKGVLGTAVTRLEGGEDPATVLNSIASEAGDLGDEADVKAKDLGLKVCGTDGDTTGSATTAPETTTAPATTSAETATTAGGTADYVADVQSAATALQEFGTVLSTSTGISDLKSKVPEAQTSLDTFDTAIAKLDGYSLGIPRLDEQRTGLARTGPKVSDVLRRFLDAAAAGDLAAVQKLVPEVTTTIGEFQKAATG